MFTIPAILSVALDATVVTTYFRNDVLFATDRGRPPMDLLNLSLCTFDVAVLAALRILFLFPYVWSCLHRLRLVYSFIPWTWLALNACVSTARLVFLLTCLSPFDVQYVMVIMSMASVLLQTACFEHLRSSAPREKRIFLASSVNRADVSARLLDPAMQHGGSVSLYDGHQEDVDFIEFITTKMKAAKQYWTDKTEALRDYLTDLSQGRDDQPFNLLLRLFKYDDVLGELDEVFAHDPSSIEFYIPQLVTFLLYGAFWSSASLQAFLLDKCSRSVTFAHRLYWFLNASCLSGSGINPEGLGQVRGLMAEVVIRGQVAARLLDQGKTPQEEEGEEDAAEQQQQHESSQPKDAAGGGSAVAGAGQSTAHTVIDMGSLNSMPDLRDEPKAERRRSPAAVGALSTTSPPSSPSRFPLEMGHYRGRDVDYFRVLPRFVDELVAISQSLNAVPREGRTGALRDKLKELGSSMLPCNVIYLPVGNAYHRVWRVHAVESSSFSTKERVPCLVCFEVVDYHAPASDQAGSGNRGRRWWDNLMKGEGMPNLSHTFRLGSKEWTFNLGDRSHHGTSSSSHGHKKDQQHGPEAALLAPGSKDHHHHHHHQATAHSSASSLASSSMQRSDSMGAELPPQPAGLVHPLLLDRERSGSFASPSDQPGMGQWGSKGPTPPGPSTPQLQAGRRGGGMDEEEHKAPLLSIRQQEEEEEEEEEAREAQPSPPQPSGRRAGGSRLEVPAPVPSSEDKRPPAGGGEDRGSPPDAAAALMMMMTNPAMMTTHVPSHEEEEEEEDEKELQHPPPSSSCTSPLAVTDDYGTFSPPPPPLPSPLSICDDAHLTTPQPPTDGSDATSAAVGPSPPVIFKERWRQKEARIRRKSPIGHLPGWRLLPVIIKSNDDLRQEQFASQLLRQVDKIVRAAHLPVWLRPYDIIATSIDGGMLEAIPDTVSLDALRRNDTRYTTLLDFFERLFGPQGSSRLSKARRCFVESMAAYSIICFLLQIKDRHNGNILLDAQGHLIHIDFGFMLARSPGNVNFERAPFKLTAEFVELMEGPRSATFKRFRELCVKTYMELRRQRHKVILLVEMVANGNENLPCFAGNAQAAVEALRQRFQPELNDRACIEFVNTLVDQSLDNWSTRWYDRYQSCFVGIA